MLRDHMVLAHMPAGTKPFVCQEEGCGWSFALKHQLKAHQKTHNREYSEILDDIRLPSSWIFTALSYQ